MSLSRRQSSEKTSSQETVRRARLEDLETIKQESSSSSAGKSSRNNSLKNSPPHQRRSSKRLRTTVESNSEEDTKMTSSSKGHSSSSKKHSSSKSKSSKSDNWTDVTEPEERRRIQNRLAQRKFREKAKEQKEKSERESRNQELAGSSYTIPAPDELLGDEDECSGLPWGSISMRHVVSQGHRSRSQKADDSVHDDDYYARGDNVYGTYVGYDTYQATTSPSYHSYGSHDNSSGGGGDFLDDQGYYYTDYDATGSQ